MPSSQDATIIPAWALNANMHVIAVILFSIPRAQIISVEELISSLWLECTTTVWHLTALLLTTDTRWGSYACDWYFISLPNFVHNSVTISVSANRHCLQSMLCNSYSTVAMHVNGQMWCIVHKRILTMCNDCMHLAIAGGHYCYSMAVWTA
jgi:hypothetical protein